ncbi:putative tetratricopeptide-like helical domain-containing protein [Rosa chinensis]|uniref:Putative tetratricopeptide-like helical domain-containing protein n=1 Tax=Rosa chinensis TaxID=74649 RepID=A0A2P6QM57_ROSCH|nr:pentatricopeptide repeat-containing protein At5g59600 [Rosa chinensis]PRQ35244.1 putative tetratricopeptide-like helical domain-containing protein [Rosa chinensis]
MKTPSFSLFKFSPDHFALCLQNCLKAKTLRQGKQVHAVLLSSGVDMNLLSLSSKLVGMYASCGDVSSARKVFDKIPKPNVFSLNWMVFASAFNGWFEQAIGYFCLMRELGIVANKFSFPVMLKVCVGLMDLNKGKEVHAVVYKMGFEKDVALGNALVDMYCKCGSLCYGHRVFDRMFERDVASWTSMICGYCNVGRTDQAAMLFERMKLDGLEPNDFTWNAMIAGYARSGDSNRAYVLLSRMTKEGLVPDLVTWNAIISGFSQSQEAGEALKLFSAMLVSGIKPNLVTITGLLPACGVLGSVERGREIHGLICRMGFDINVFVASALIDMYSKCGSVKNARSVFDWTPVYNVASWNAMIGCYGKHGMVDSAVELFERMQEGGVQANEVTLSCVLSACSHSGSVEKGLEIFRSMKESHGVEASKEHYGCVVDLLCRSGKMVEAYEFVKSIPLEVTESIIGALLNGCKVHGRRDLAKLMAQDILKMELKRPGGFVTLSNIYAADGEWEEVEYVRKVMKQRKVLKKPGFSSLD